jgi:hypothetical protein
VTQLSLPWFNPRDRGRLNALRNIVAAVSDELRQQAPIARSIVAFTTDQLPRIMRQDTPFPIESADTISPYQISPYPFTIQDFVQLQRRPETEVFATVADLINNIEATDLAKPLQDVELIGIDESKVDTPLPQSTLSFMKSIAFRMYKFPDGSTDEAAGPILSKLRMQLRDDEGFEAENQFLGYIRNNFVAYISILTSLSFGRQPFVVLHGPLVRTIGGFSNITFSYDMARELLNLNLEDAGQYELPAGHSSPIVPGDIHIRQNMSTILREAINGEKNLRRFNEFCLKRCERRCASCRVYPEKAVPPDQQTVTNPMIKQRDYPGFCLYFWMLRSLADITRLSHTTIASVVENTLSATEMTRIILPSLFANAQAYQAISQSDLRSVLQALRIPQLATPAARRELYRQVKQLIDSLHLSDSNIFSYVLAEGQYTAPVQVYRYRTRNTFEAALADNGLGIHNDFENILNALFPSQGIEEHPGYRVLMSYVRTTPLREPIRVEYFDLPHLQPAKNVLGPIYLLSLPYQEYGLPIILYYADKIARTPAQLVRAIIEREYLELVLENRFSDPVSIMRVLGRLTRGYFQREGFQ